MKNLVSLSHILFLFLALVTLKVKAEVPIPARIISTDGFVTELIFALQAQDKLIAVDVTSKLPEGYKTLPNIGYHRNLSAEGLLSLEPGMVIGSEHVGPENVISTLQAADIPLLRLSSAKTANQLFGNVDEVATALDQPAKGKTLIARLAKSINSIPKKQLSQHRIAFLLSMDPSKLRLAGSGTNGDALIKLLGAKNVGDFENFQNVSAESLLAINPTVILVAGKIADTAVYDLLERQSVLKFSAAAKANQILSVDGSTLIAGLSISAVNEALNIAKTLSESQQD